jgi:hypothetical protein
MHRFTTSAIQINQKESEIAITTIPTMLSLGLVTEPLMRFRMPDGNATAFTIQLPQPYVYASCTKLSAVGAEDIYLTDKSEKLLVNPRGLYEKRMLVNQTFKATNQEILPTLWASAAENPHTLAALTPLEIRLNGSIDCLICIVSAFWRMTRTTLAKSNGVLQITSEMPDSRKILAEDLRPIDIDPAIMKISRGVSGVVNPTDTSDPASWAMALADNVASVLTAIPNHSFDYEMMKAFNSSQLEIGSDITLYRVDMINYGFGYGIRDIPAQLSIAVITAYCLITILYVGYIIATGHTSIAWGSPTELILLALQSKEPSNIGSISVGVDSTRTLRRNVGIRVSTIDIGDLGRTKEKLELVFEHDEETKKRALTKVVRNRAY